MYVKYGILQFENVVIPILSNNSTFYWRIISKLSFTANKYCMLSSWNSRDVQYWNDRDVQYWNDRDVQYWNDRDVQYSGLYWLRWKRSYLLDEINNRFKYNRFIIIVPNGFNKICQLNINDYCV
jgi:hypothetical protein